MGKTWVLTQLFVIDDGITGQLMEEIVQILSTSTELMLFLDR